MYKHAWRPEPRENPIGQIANALRGAARKHHHIAGCECAMHRRFGLSLVTGANFRANWVALGWDGSDKFGKGRDWGAGYAEARTQEFIE